jgi:hypothetical protein
MFQFTRGHYQGNNIQYYLILIPDNDPLWIETCRNTQCDIFFMARQPYVGLGLLVSSKFQSHTHLDTPQSVGLLWTSDQPVAETST